MGVSALTFSVLSRLVSSAFDMTPSISTSALHVLMHECRKVATMMGNNKLVHCGAAVLLFGSAFFRACFKAVAHDTAKPAFMVCFELGNISCEECCTFCKYIL